MLVQPDYDIPKGTWKNFTWCVYGSLMITHYYPGEIDEGRFSACLDTMKTRDLSHLLSTGIGAAQINSVQRKKATDVVKNMKIAALVDSAITRGLITAFGWLGVDVKSFPPAKLDEAIEYLGVPGISTQDIRVAYETLKDRSKPAK